MTKNAESAFDALCQHARETAMLASIEDQLGWDERTYMPPAAGEYRAEQITYLSGLVHRRRTDSRIREWLEELSDSPLAKDPHSDAGATIRQIRRQYEKLTKLPADLVEELTRTSVLGQQKWVAARQNDDFASFRPLLERIIDLKRQQAEAYGWQDSIYDPLLDDYEPDAKTVDVTRVLADLRQDLVPLVSAIAESHREAPVAVLQRRYRAAAQEAFGKLVAARIGFDFQRGRLDVTHHPFCSSTGPNDCRITTRYQEHLFSSSFFSILHEAGHGIYDQGLRTDQYGLPPGTYVSLGIHESQSRMWENFVGRSRSFWRYFFPAVQGAFPQALGDVPAEDFYFAVNDVRPSLIRVEADEATYNLHIIVRFELEQALVKGDLKAADLPAAWSEKYQEYLGVDVPTDADGVLQDVHWSAALIGYFPTYSLGNLYAAQFFEQADADLGGLDEQFERANFSPLREWLRDKIHTHGQCYSAAELVKRVTGKPLTHAPLMRHLRGKLESLYGLS